VRVSNPITVLRNWLNSYSRQVSAKSGYTISSELIKVSVLYLSVQAIASLALAIILVRLGPRVSLLFILISALSLTAIGMINAYIVIRLRSRARKFEKSIVTILLTTIPLMASGEPLVNVFNYLATIRIEPEVNGEFRRLVSEVYSGFDIVSAIKRSIERVPSRVYNDVMSIIAESYGVSGNIADVLALKLDSIIRREQSMFRSRTQALSLMMEVYVVSAQLLPILLIILTISLAPLGSIPISPEALILLMFLVYVPVVGSIFYMVMSGLLD